MRTAAQPPEAVLVDLRTHRVFVGVSEVKLSRLEFDLLAFLARDPDRCISRSDLLRDVWGYAHYEGARTRTVEQHISQVRRKLRQFGIVGALENVYGVGYRFEVSAEVVGE